MRYLQPRTKPPTFHQIYAGITDSTVCANSWQGVRLVPIHDPANGAVSAALWGSGLESLLKEQRKKNGRAASKFLIWCYGIAEFADCLPVRDLVDEHGWRIEFLIDLDPPGIIVLRKGRLSLTLWDLRNWLTVSWQELCALCDRYHALTSTLGHLAPAALTGPEAKLAIVNAAAWQINQLCKERWHTFPRATAAAQALHVYANVVPLANGPTGYQGRRHWNPTWTGAVKRFPLLHGDQDQLVAERQALHGGVVTCFRPREKFGEVHTYDAQALYLWLGTKHDFPVKYLDGGFGMDYFRIACQSPANCGFAYATINSQENPYPVRVGAEVKYVRGYFKTWLAWPELVYALEHDDLQDVGPVSVYAAEPLFRHFSEHMLYERAHASESASYFNRAVVKRIGNALWGKFGQLNDDWRRDGNAIPYERWSMWSAQNVDTREVYLYRSLGSEVWFRCGTFYPRHAMPIIAATMTSWARCYMLDVLHSLPADSVTYCASDCIHLNACASGPADRDERFFGSGPGKFSRRDKLTNVTYARPGWWVSDQKSVHSGVPVDASVDDEGRFCFERKGSLRTLLSTPNLYRLRNGEVQINPPEATRRTGKIPREYRDLWRHWTQTPPIRSKVVE